jgi:hypothetical protein
MKLVVDLPLDGPEVTREDEDTMINMVHRLLFHPTGPIHPGGLPLANKPNVYRLEDNES